MSFYLDYMSSLQHKQQPLTRAPLELDNKVSQSQFNVCSNCINVVLYFVVLKSFRKGKRFL